MGKEKIKRIIPYGCILILCGYFYGLANQFQFAVKPGHLGPDFWPKLLLGLTMVVCLYEIARTALLFKGKGEQAEEKQEEQAEETKFYPVALIAGTILTVAYVYVVSVAGFILCTFLYLLIFMILGRYRKLWAVLLNSAIGTGVLVFLFMKVVYVSLPMGVGPFQQFSLLVLKMLGIK